MPIYMKFDGIDGDSSSQGHERWFNVFSFSWGESNPAPHNVGGAGVGKTTFNDVSIVKQAGKGSPKLFLNGANGRYISSVIIEVTRQLSEQEMLFERFTLTDSLITGYQIGGDGGSLPVESLTLSYTKMEFLQVIQAPTGAASSETASWNLKTNSGG